LTIATRNLPLGVGGSLLPGDYVAVRVTDTGIGMTPELIAHVFEPFFTTKEAGLGSGLGLSQVHGLATQSGGDVRIRSKPAGGTTVTLLLPRAKSLPIALQPDPRSTRRTIRRRARILVVDDDRDVRQMTGEVLTERGYSVELAADADEALAILRRDGGFDAMLVDYVMPGANGASLVKIVRSLRPGLRTLMMTGHAEVQAGEEIGTENIIRKPFSVATLDERLARLLAGPMLRVVQGEVGAGIILNRLLCRRIWKLPDSCRPRSSLISGTAFRWSVSRMGRHNFGGNRGVRTVGLPAGRRQISLQTVCRPARRNESSEKCPS
jgi:CheY-like chemotaxis protein